MIRISALLFMSLVLAACGGGSGDATSSAPAADSEQLARVDIRDLDQLVPFRAEGPYVEVLKNCATINSEEEICDLQTLPFIWQTTNGSEAVTPEKIMERVLVTHSWMGERFEAVLNEAPAMMLNMFGAVTSIRLGSTVRPSSFSGWTGGIRLDSANLWLTVEEKANVFIEDDYRSGFGDGLGFIYLKTFRTGNQIAFPYYSLLDQSERGMDDIKLMLYELLYHELAHAVDQLQFGDISTLDSSQTPRDVYNSEFDDPLSVLLYRDFPLYSFELLDLAQVRWAGVEATDEQKSFNADYAGSLMSGDGATGFYAYRTIREDFADLFASSMMKIFHDVDVYMGFVDRPQTEFYSCTDLLVGWGTKNRLPDPLVTPRVKWTHQQIFGEQNYALIDDYFANNLGVFQEMLPGIDWCSNVNSSNPASKSLNSMSPETAEPFDIREFVVLDRHR